MSKKVYIIIRYYKGEIFEIYGAFETIDKAKTFVEEKKKKRSELTPENFEIMEMSVK